LKNQTICLLILTLLAASLLTPTLAGAKTPDEKQVLVGFNDFSNQALIRTNGWKVNYEYRNIPVVACSLPQQAIDALQNNPNIAYIEDDVEVNVAASDYELANSWGVVKIGADKA
jgi:subtilisin